MVVCFNVGIIIAVINELTIKVGSRQYNCPNFGTYLPFAVHLCIGKYENNSNTNTY